MKWIIVVLLFVVVLIGWWRLEVSDDRREEEVLLLRERLVRDSILMDSMRRELESLVEASDSLAACIAVERSYREGLEYSLRSIKGGK